MRKIGMFDCTSHLLLKALPLGHFLATPYGFVDKQPCMDYAKH